MIALLVLGARSAPTTGYSEDHVYALASQMKCLQCVGESVANSQAQIAVQMRDEILSYFADRYGKRVLLKPSSSGLAALVWIVPVVVIATAVTMMLLTISRSRSLRLSQGDSSLTSRDRELVEAARHEHDADGDDPDESDDGDG